MDIEIKHLGKAYGEQQILKDFYACFRKGKLPVSGENLEVERQLCFVCSWDWKVRILVR